MKKIVALTVHNLPFVNILILIILIGGIVGSFAMVREIFPTFSVDVVTVNVIYPGADPEEVEEGISRKLEEAVEGVENIKRFHTTASEGVGSAFVEIREGADVQEVKDEISERVNAITTFPVDAEKPIVTELKLKSPVLQIAVSGELPERQLKELAEDIKDDIEVLPHISQVSVGGTRQYEIAIEISEERLREYGITFEEVSRAVRLGSMNLPGGTLRGFNEELTVRTIGRRYTGEEFAKLVVLADETGTLITLDKIADIQDEFEEEGVYGTFNGKRAAIVTVLKTEDEDSIAISREVQEFIARKKAELPPTVTLTKWADNSVYVQDRLDLLLRNGRIGLILVFFVLWAFLDLRLSFWVALGIPISIAGALGMMALTGLTLNMITLFALIMIIGIIVDDAIVVGESIYVKRKEGLPPVKAALEGVGEVGWPVVAAVTTTIVAFLPLMFVGDVMGKFIRMLPIVVIWALSFSLIESLFLLPAHLSHLPDMNASMDEMSFVKRRLVSGRRRMSGLVDWTIARLYSPLIEAALRFRYLVIALAIALLLIVFGLLQGGVIKYVVFPKLDSDTMLSRVEFPEGTPYEITRRAVERIEEGLMELNEEFREDTGRDLVLSRYAIVGAHTGQEPASGSNFGEVNVELLPTDERNIHYLDLIEQWQENVGPIVGALSYTYEGMEAGPGGKDIEIWLLGEQMDSLIDAAERLKDRLATTKGVYEIQDDFRPGKREIRATLKPSARPLGITVGSLAEQLRHGFYGAEAVRIQRGRDDIRVKIRYPLAERRSLGDFEKVRIRTPIGAEVPLLAVADISLEQGYASIKRQDGKRRIAVTASVRAFANANEIVNDLQQDFLPGLLMTHPSLRYSIEGAKRTSAEAMKTLVVGFPLAMLGIFLILATVFRSYFQPFVIMITIPFGLIGAILGHLLLGLEVTLMSMFGMVALSGIVVNDSIVLIEAINERLKDGTEFMQALRDGGKRRFRPIMLTTVTTAAGLTPLILERSFQAQFLIPMAVSIAFGVCFGTTLTLLLIPCLLVFLNDLKRVWILFWTGKWPNRQEVEAAVRLAVEEREE